MTRPPGPVHTSTQTRMLGPGSSRPSKGLYFSSNSLMRRKSAFYFFIKAIPAQVAAQPKHNGGSPATDLGGQRLGLQGTGRLPNIPSDTGLLVLKTGTVLAYPSSPRLLWEVDCRRQPVFIEHKCAASRKDTGLTQGHTACQLSQVRKGC